MEIDWQNNLNELKDRGQYLLQSEKWSDCRFLVGTMPNQRLFAGHRLVLAMASPIFERMFYGNLADKPNPIVIPDVQPDAFEALLDYIYSDRINIASFEKACELCYVAKKYMLPYVVERCTHFLWADLNPKNACRAYEFAKLFDEPRLMASSMELIASNTREVITDPSFLDIEVSTLLTILDQDRLKIDTELDLFNCLIRFANEHGILNDDNTANAGSANENDVVVEEIKMEPDVTAMMHNHVDEDEHNDNYASSSANDADEVVVINNDASASGNADIIDLSSDEPAANTINIMYIQRTAIDENMLRQAVKKIRFLTMTPKQFAEGPARSKLLQPNEALAILIKISSPTINDCPMPEGFCQSRSSRSFYESHRQRDLSSYRNSAQSNILTTAHFGNNSFFTLFNPSVSIGPQLPAAAGVTKSNATSPSGTVTSHHQHNTSMTVNLTNCASNGSEQAGGVGDNNPSASRTEMARSYCVRTFNQQFDYRNSSVTDCGLTFQVDTNIWILGVQVPTQVLCGELMNSAGFTERYTEILYAHIQNMQGSRITYTHCTARVRYDSLFDLTFDRPVYIHRNQNYKIYVVFNKTGWYKMSSCVPDVVYNRVKFMFDVGNPTESVRDGLIHAIIFSTPQDH